MKIILCTNPFDRGREQKVLHLAKGKSIGFLLKRCKLESCYTVAVNGQVLEREEGLAYVPRPGDDVMLVPELQNPALKTIAMIGVQIGAAFLVGPLSGVLGPMLHLADLSAKALSATLLSLAGSLAVGGVASLLQHSPGGNNYGVLGPSTVARSGIPIPKGYGTFRAGGNIVESWIDIQGNNQDQHDVDDGADTIGRQYINGRVDFGWGPAKSFNQILLNGQDINSYGDVCYFLRYGTNDQGAVYASDPNWIQKNLTTTGTTTNTQPTTDFTAINNNYPRNMRVRAGIDQNYVIVPGQREDTEKLTVYVTFPQGVWRLDDSNTIKRAAISYDVYYRLAGTGDAGWVHVAPNWGTPNGESHYYYNIRQTLLRQATIIDGLAPGRYDVKIVKNGAGAVLDGNPLDYFEHESNKWGDQLWVESVQETAYTTLMYKNTIQLCFRIMATDQISGSDLQFQADIDFGLSPRLTQPAELATYSDDTPAVVTWDALADPLYGGNWTDIDLPFFGRWAAHTSTLLDDGDGGTVKRAVFNGIFDKSQNIWQAASSVAVMSYANLQRIGRKVTGWLDAPDVPVQMFTMGNIAKDSYEKTYLNLEDRSVEVECSFADVADDYKQRNPVRLVSAGAITQAQAAIKKQPVNLFGCTNRPQAYYWTALHLNENVNVLRTHTWKSNAQAVRCRVGNVVLLQHDVPGYGYGGVCMPKSTASTIIFDRNDQPFTTTDTWELTIQHPALQVATVEITAIVAGPSGVQVNVAAVDGSLQLDRLVQGNVDVAITNVSGNVLTVEDGTGLVAGAAAIWGLDVMETRTVTSLKKNKATVSEPFSIVPAAYAQFIYQSSTKKALLVRVKQIKKDPGKQRYTLTAIDYADSNYVIPAPDGTTKPPVPAAYRPAVLLNGWGNNQHVGDYEGRSDQGHVWGLNDDTTLPYTTPEAAVDGSTATYASCVQLHTHQYAGCIWTFQLYAGQTLQGATLSVLSSVPDAEAGVANNGRSSSMWYSLDGGSNWTRIYDASSRPQQWDSVTLPNGQDAGQIQVMAFMDSHDDMAHNVYDITLTGMLS